MEGKEEGREEERGQREEEEEWGGRGGRGGREKVDDNKVSSRSNPIHIYTILYKVSVTHAMVFETVVRP